MSNLGETSGKVIWEGFDAMFKLGVKAWNGVGGTEALKEKLKTFFRNSHLVIKGKDGKIDYQPVLVKTIQTNYGYHLILKLYPGIWIGTLIEKQPELSSALGGETHIYQKDNFVHIRVFTREIPKRFYYREDLAAMIKKHPCAIPIGISRPGIVLLPLNKDDTFAMLIAGMPGSGKSVFLRQALLSAIMNYAQEEVQLYLIDMKQGIEFFPFQATPHTAAWAGDSAGATRVLRLAIIEMEHRAELMKEKQVTDIESFNTLSGIEKLPHIILAIDEYAGLNEDHKKDVGELCRAGRFAGIHPIVCTQRPTADVLSGTTKNLIPVVLCFRMSNRYNAQLVLGKEGSHAAYINVQGRGIFASGYMREIQVMYLSAKQCQAMILDRYGSPQSQQLPATTKATSW